MKNEIPPARMRLPEGFSHLRADLEQILKDHRTGVTGVVGPISQDALALSVGITRVALSRIENGHTWPQCSTLDRNMHELELGWPQVAIAGDSSRHRSCSTVAFKARKLISFVSACAWNAGRMAGR